MVFTVHQPNLFASSIAIWPGFVCTVYIVYRISDVIWLSHKITTITPRLGLIYEPGSIAFAQISHCFCGLSLHNVDLSTTEKYGKRVVLNLCDKHEHDDVIKWKPFPPYWPIVMGIHRWPVDSPHKGQWRGALRFYLIWTSTNGWANYRDAGDLRRHRGHYVVTVMNMYLCFYQFSAMRWCICWNPSSWKASTASSN